MLKTNSKNKDKDKKKDTEMTTYYVATTGNDSNPGTESLPFRNIQKGADIVNPGDTVIVKDGVYTAPPGQSGNIYIVINYRSGTVDNPITFKAEHKWGVVLDGQKDSNPSYAAFMCWHIYTASYITVQDFECKNAMWGGINMGDGSTGGAKGNIIHGNKIHDIGMRCEDQPYGISGCGADQASDGIFDSNLMYNIGRYFCDDPRCYSKPCAHDINTDHGLYWNANNMTISNNIFYGIEHGWSLHFFGNYIPGHVISNTNICNNVFVGHTTHASWVTGHIILAEPAININIFNNISYNPNGCFVNFYNTSPTNITINNNLVYGTYNLIECTGDCTHTESDNIFGQDPLFVDVINKDFHLQAGSPAIGKGLSTGAPIYDFDGNLRSTTAPCIGAYEYIGCPDPRISLILSKGL